jgi:hypothetical protein
VYCFNKAVVIQIFIRQYNNYKVYSLSQSLYILLTMDLSSVLHGNNSVSTSNFIRCISFRIILEAITSLLFAYNIIELRDTSVASESPLFQYVLLTYLEFLSSYTIPVKPDAWRTTFKI